MHQQYVCVRRHIALRVLISTLGSVALSVCSPITNHWSAALALPKVKRRFQKQSLPQEQKLEQATRRP